MADPRPMEDESKKDTVRINLPAGGPARAATPVPPGPPTQKLKPEGDPKKDTAVMGTPAPQPKRDTSRVQVAAAKPTAPETPRPTVRLRREESAAPSAIVAPSAAPAPAPVIALKPSGAEVSLAVGAMVLSIAVLAYLASVALG